jgi:hypothetical protein
MSFPVASSFPTHASAPWLIRLTVSEVAVFEAETDEKAEISWVLEEKKESILAILSVDQSPIGFSVSWTSFAGVSPSSLRGFAARL